MLTIEPQRTTRDGIAFNFRGMEPDSEGKPTGELIDVELIVPPLNLDSLRALNARLQSMGEEPTTDSMETLVLALGHALARNYRNVPDWLISQTIDVANMPAIAGALMDLSGLRRKELEDAKKARAPETAQQQTTGANLKPGTDSTPAS